jgi:hypothetical protein
VLDELFLVLRRNAQPLRHDVRRHSHQLVEAGRVLDSQLVEQLKRRKKKRRKDGLCTFSRSVLRKIAP